MSNTDNKGIKPPLGIKPEWLWKEERLYELNSAVIRYVSEDMPIPPEWIEEIKSLREWIDKRKASHSIKEEEVGWEVVSLADTYGGGYTVYPFNCASKEGDDRFKIHSVRRESDGEVFTVGDDVSNGYISGNIRLFVIITESNRESAVSASISDSNNVGKIAVSFSQDIPNNLLEDLQKAHKKQLLSIDEAPENRCNVCGGEMVLIRGRYPKEDKRYTCPTCVTERLEQINEISSNHYGKTCNSNN